MLLEFITQGTHVIAQVTSAHQFNAVIFKDKASAPLSSRAVSLFPGLGYAAAYKVDSSVTPPRSPSLTGHRSSNGCINTEVNHSYAITLPKTMVISLTEASARALEKH